MRRVLLLLLAAASTIGARESLAQVPGGGGIIYGSHYSFMIEAPPGWVIDNRAGRANDLDAVFYRTGETWQHGAAVMYANASGPDSGQVANPLQVIAEDSARFVSQAPGVRIVSAPLLHTHDHGIAYVRYFSGEPNGRYEAVAYIAERTVTPMITLSARTQDAFQAALPAFAQLVGSYSFFSSNVQIKH